MIRNWFMHRSQAGWYGLAALLTILAFLAITLWVSSQQVYALPEYSVRTGESCAVCHANPGGGGPRTLRGLLWSARGRSDVIPELPGILIAPRVTDEAELYEIACAGCHGKDAEGLSAMGLRNMRISEASVRSFTLRGIPGLGMPAFAGQLSDEQLETLVRYVAGLSSGEISPPEQTNALPPVMFRCPQSPVDPICDPAGPEPGGN